MVVIAIGAVIRANTERREEEIAGEKVTSDPAHPEITTKIM